MFEIKKKVARLTVYSDDSVTVRARAIDVVKMYLACRRLLIHQGMDLDKMNEMQDAVRIVGTGEIRKA